jgi:hypothetical protein
MLLSGKQKGPSTVDSPRNSSMPMNKSATSEECQEHLEAFIQTFIAPSRRERWTLFMFKKPEKAAVELHRLPLDPRRTTWLEGPERTYSEYLRYAGARLGIYFNFRADPVWMAADDAASRADCDFEDAILSIEPGKLAIYFSHDAVSALLTRT